MISIEFRERMASILALCAMCAMPFSGAPGASAFAAAKDGPGEVSALMRGRPNADSLKTKFYVSSSDPSGYVIVSRNAENVTVWSSARWQAIGWLVGNEFQGVARRVDSRHQPILGPLGTLEFSVQ